jgi:hypothetical protein
MSFESTSGPRFVTIPEAYAAVYDASDSILKTNQQQIRDEAEHPLIAEHINGLLDVLRALRPVPGERLREIPLVNVDSFLSGLHEQIRTMDDELTMQNGGVPLGFMQLPPEVGALFTVSLQVEAELNGLDRGLN